MPFFKCRHCETIVDTEKDTHEEYRGDVYCPNHYGDLTVRKFQDSHGRISFNDWNKMSELKNGIKRGLR